MKQKRPTPARSLLDVPLFLFPGVGEVIEVDGLAVAVDPGGDEAEAVEAGAGGAGAFDEGEFHRLLVEVVLSYFVSCSSSLAL